VPGFPNPFQQTFAFVFAPSSAYISPKQSPMMTKLSSLLLILLASRILPIAAQDTPTRQNSAIQASCKEQLLPVSRKVTKMGEVLLCSANQRLYQILDSETLRHLEGEYVTLKACFLPEKGQL
jgi:hypothetical protein